MAKGLLLLLVVHTFREDDGRIVIRIITARQPTRYERWQYEQRKNMQQEHEDAKTRRSVKMAKDKRRKHGNG